MFFIQVIVKNLIFLEIITNIIVKHQIPAFIISTIKNCCLFIWVILAN